LVGIDLRVADPSLPSGSRRAKIPVESLNWLLQKLEQQGITQQMIGSFDQSTQADLGKIVSGQGYNAKANLQAVAQQGQMAANQ
jgi:hypothetical protein